MTLFLLCMLPVAASLGFIVCALLQTAATADRPDEAYFVQQDSNPHKEEGG